jgi:catechol 2,3-dioxygenase-like lactoylglutathione lyase family enzyme
MPRKLSVVTLLVRDQDEALDFYVDKLSFEKRDDRSYGEGFRWLTVAAPGQDEPALTLVKADTDEKRQAIGKQAAGQPLFVLETDDFDSTYQDMKSRGVEFAGEPENLPWGKEVVFRDLYGNLFDLLQPAS